MAVIDIEVRGTLWLSIRIWDGGDSEMDIAEERAKEAISLAAQGESRLQDAGVETWVPDEDLVSVGDDGEKPPALDSGIVQTWETFQEPTDGHGVQGGASEGPAATLPVAPNSASGHQARAVDRSFNEEAGDSVEEAMQDDDGTGAEEHPGDRQANSQDANDGEEQYETLECGAYERSNDGVVEAMMAEGDDFQRNVLPASETSQDDDGKDATSTPQSQPAARTFRNPVYYSSGKNKKTGKPVLPGVLYFSGISSRAVLHVSPVLNEFYPSRSATSGTAEIVFRHGDKGKVGCPAASVPMYAHHGLMCGHFFLA